MQQDRSKAWSPGVGETVRVVRIGTLGRVVRIKAGSHGPEFVIHALTQVGRGDAVVASPPDRMVCTLDELAPHETPTG